MVGLVGHTGFVGSNIARQTDFTHCFNSKNIGQIEGSRFELLVFSGIQAVKWWACAHPEDDWAGIEAAIAPLRSVEARQVVLVSTIDVLPPRPGADETFDPHGHPNHAYGENRLRVEDYFRETFDNVLVVRLPDLFGRGLKKNIVFDLLNDNQLDKINPSGLLQLYCLDQLWGHVDLALRAGLDVVNFVTEPCTAASIASRFFPGKAIGPPADGAVSHDFRTRHSKIFGRADGFLLDRSEVMGQLGDFVARYQGE